MMASAPELSVLIPSFEGAHRLRDTLAGLEPLASDHCRHEVIICDDGSSKPVSAEVGHGCGFPVRVERSTTNRGRSAACNRALAAATGRIILVLDDDMTARPGLVEAHLAAHPAEQAPQAVIGRIDTDPSFFRGPFGEFLAAEESQRRQQLLDAREKIPFTHCLTGHFSIPRQSLLDVGGYNERFSRYGFEDIELAWRIERSGLPLVYKDELNTCHRSEHAGFETHCARHFESGAMAVLFSAEANDPRVDRFLRIEGMPWHEQRGGFRKLMAFYHGLTRRCPVALMPYLLGLARIKVWSFGLVAPRGLLHVSYHIVRDMHYAAGIIHAKQQEAAMR